MEWFDEQEGQETGLDAAFTVIGEGPPALTARQAKTLKDPGGPWEAAARDLTLQAYPILHPQETEASRLQRAAAFDAVWLAVESRVRSCLDSTDAAVFASLLDFARARHPSRDVLRSTPPHGLHRLPTGLVLAGGVNSADHTRTFPNLAAHLRAEGCYVALLQPHNFARSLAEALNAALRQWSGAAAAAGDSADALAAWYRDEVGIDDDIGEENLDPAAAAAAEVAIEEGEEAGPGSGRGLRRANEPSKQEENQRRPLVLVVESAEGVQDSSLCDLVTVMSDGWTGLPVCLVLGLTTSAAALNDALPPSLVGRALDCQLFSLASAIARLDALVDGVLLQRWPGLLMDPGVVSTLWEDFMMHYFSPGIIVRGWKVAALAHFRGHLAAGLAAAAIDGDAAALAAACSELDSAAASALRRSLSLKSGGGASSSLGAVLSSVILGWERWALAIRCAASAAHAVGLANGYNHWQLFRDASVPNFNSSAIGKELLARLDQGLKQLDAAKAALAVEGLERVAQGHGSGAAASELLDLLKGVKAALAGGSADDQAPAAAAKEAGEEEGRGAAAGAEQEAPAVEGSCKAAPKRRDRYHSKASRTNALLSKARTQGAARTGAGAQGERSAAEATALPGARVAAALSPWLSRCLGALPARLPGAAALTCRDVGCLDSLSAAPREAVHAALTRPELFAGGPSSAVAGTAIFGIGGNMGVTCRAEDACVAYQLFDQDPACANVADWFTAFREVITDDTQAGGKEGDEEEEEEGQAAGKKRKAKGGKGKGKGKGKTAPQRRPSAEDKEEERRRKVAAAELDRELTARFSQAAAELQFVGLIRPTKKRRGDNVQRAVHMPAPVAGTF